MTDLTPILLPRLQAHRLEGFDLGDDLIYPHYSGQSILNIPASVCHWLGAPPFGSPRLYDDLLAPAGEDIRRVILLLVDALGLLRLQSWLGNGDLPLWQSLLAGGTLAPLTSVSPSTTSAALTSLWTGSPPAAHGVMGYEMWLKEYGIIANMILHTPNAYHHGDVGGLANAGFDPATFLPVPRLGSHLKAHGVESYAFQHYTIARSGLSRMFFNDVQVQPFGSPADLWVDVRQLLEAQGDSPLFTWVYWGAVDSLSHRYGPEDERSLAAFEMFSGALQHNFLDKLGPEKRKGTLLVLAADHGQITTRKDPHYELRSHDGLARRLHMSPTGENRLMYLYPRPGQLEAVREYIQRSWPGQFSMVDSAYALHSGLFGDGEKHPRISERIGDLVAVAHDEAYLWWNSAENMLIGRHGGLHPLEMLVPFATIRLD